MLFYLLQGLTFGLSAAATPGPFQAYLLSQTVKQGWRRTLPAALAPLISDGPIIALVLLLLTQTPNWFLKGVQVVGGLFILYLAWGAYQAFRRYVPYAPAEEESAQRGVLQAALMNLLNPNPYIFWSLIGGPILLEGWRVSASLGLAFLVGIYVALIGGLAALIILFATAQHLGPRINRALIALSALALAAFGLYQIGSGLAAFVGSSQ